MLSISGDKEEIFKRVKSGFSDYALFDRLVATKLRDAIKDAEGLEITVKATEKVAEKYFDVKSFRTAEQRLALSQIELIFKTAYTLILSHKEENQHLLWQDVKTLVEHYPEFTNADIPELQLLLRYRNAVRIALLVIPPRRNKALIMKIAERLEGSQKDYITGGGQSLDVKRRVKIYEQEGQIEAEKRPPRERKPKQRLPGQEKTPAVSAFSVKRAKLVRLPAEEIYTVARLSGEPLIAVAAPKNVNNYVPPQLPSVPLVAPLPQPPAPKSVTTISPPAAPVEPPPLVTLAAASEASTRLALPVPKEEVKEKEPIWSPLAELSSVASSLPPMLSEFPGFPSAAEIPFASSFSLSRESSISSSALLGLSRAPSDNLSLYLSMTDPEYWRRAQTGADLSPLPHTALLPNPLLRGDSLGLYSGIMGPPAPLQRSSSNGKSSANAQAAGGLFGGEASLGFYSGNFDADMDQALKRTASSPQKPQASVQAAKGARKQAKKAKQ